MSHPFDAATSVVAAGDGRWTGEIDPGWSAPIGPNGGYVASIVLRAMVAAVDDERRAPRTLTLHYLRPPTAGPVEVTVTVERAGRTLISLSGRLEQDGRVCALALAAFTVELPAGEVWSEAMPAVAPAAETRRLPVFDGAPPIFARMDLRAAIGARPFTGADEGRTGGWLAFDAPRAVDALACATYVDAWWPAAFLRMTEPAAVPTLELTVHFRSTLPLAEPGHVLGLFTSRTSAGGFVEEDAELWSPDGVLLAQSRQLALVRAP